MANRACVQITLFLLASLVFTVWATDPGTWMNPYHAGLMLSAAMGVLIGLFFLLRSAMPPTAQWARPPLIALVALASGFALATVMWSCYWLARFTGMDDVEAVGWFAVKHWHSLGTPMFLALAFVPIVERRISVAPRGDMSVTDSARQTWQSHRTKALAVLAAVLVVVVGAPLYADWAEKRDLEKEKREVEKRNTESNRVNVRASLTAIALVSAFRSCKEIGINDIDQCAEYQGRLPKEMAASVAAQRAVEQRVSYYASCTNVYPKNTCRDLLTRSVHARFTRRNVNEERP